jgi:hypothetical protein
VRSKLINTKEIHHFNFLGYFLTTLMVFLQGSFILSGNRMILLICLFASVALFMLKKQKIDKFLFYVIAFLVIISVSQVLQFGYFSYNTFLGTLIRFLLPYFIIKIIKKEYLKYYVNVIFTLTIISLIFYIPSLLFPDFYRVLLNLASTSGLRGLQEEQNFIIYTVETDVRLGFLRNAGMFWEPGAYAGFLIIALICNIVLNRKLWVAKNIILIFTILTTFSTSGYIALFMVLLLYYMLNLRTKVSFFLIPLMIFVAWYSYFNLDFLGERIEREIQTTEIGKVPYTGRIGSGIKDFQDIIKYPLFGRGRNVATRFEGYREEEILEFHRTNGLTDFLVKYGLLFSLFYFYNLYKSLRYFCINHTFNTKFALYMLLTILTIGLSQTFFQGTFFISLIYVHLALRKKPVFIDKEKGIHEVSLKLQT